MNTDKNCAVELKGIKKIYQMGEVEVPVLHGIDLKLYSSEVTVVLGPSGSGKSTLLNLIGGIDRPTAGGIIFDRHDLATFSDSRLTEYRRKSIGFVFQFYNLVPTLTAKENVEVSTEVADSPMSAEEALDLVGLADLKNNFPSQMSGGQQQRVAIARALAKNPSLMLCDEPTGALDIKTGQLVLETLMKLNKELGTTIIIITHAVPISQTAHRVIHINSGLVDNDHYNENPLKVGEINW